MNTFNRTTTCIVISAALLLGGCANTGSSLLSGTKPDPRLTTTEQSQFFSASGAQGCGVGAVSGAALGALVGALTGDSKKALAGVAIGGAAGCAAGMTANYYLDRLKKIMPPPPIVCRQWITTSAKIPQRLKNRRWR